MEYQLGFQLSCNLINKYCNINQNKFKEIILLLQLKERTLGLVCVRKITYIFLKILPCYFPISLQFCFLWLSLKKRPVTVSSTVTVVLIIVDYCIIKMYIGFVIVMLELNDVKSDCCIFERPLILAFDIDIFVLCKLGNCWCHEVDI